MMQREGFEASHACQIARVSRTGFYRHYEQHEPRQADVVLRDLIQKIALENRFYGYRRVTAELQHRGTVVNHKRVLRLMRADNLLVVKHSFGQRPANSEMPASASSRWMFIKPVLPARNDHLVFHPSDDAQIVDLLT